jgi:hypothetical protein
MFLTARKTLGLTQKVFAITGFLKFREPGSIEVNPNAILIHRKPLQ